MIKDAPITPRSSMSIRIIIVNYRTAALTVDCLTSLAAKRAIGELFAVVVVENASPDDSADLLPRAIAQHDWAEWVDSCGVLASLSVVTTTDTITLWNRAYECGLPSSYLFPIFPAGFE